MEGGGFWGTVKRGKSEKKKATSSLSAVTAKVAEHCRVVLSRLPSKPSSLVRLSPLTTAAATTTTTTSINPRDASNTFFFFFSYHRIKLNIKTLRALPVTGATVLGLLRTQRAHPAASRRPLCPASKAARHSRRGGLRAAPLLPQLSKVRYQRGHVTLFYRFYFYKQRKVNK